MILIDETLARQYLAESRIRSAGACGCGASSGKVVGIVGQVHHYGLEKQPEPTIYAPFEQMTDKSMALAVRTTWTRKPW